MFLRVAFNDERITNNDIPGGLAGGVTPVPIPNTVVTPSRADATAAARRGTVGRRRALDTRRSGAIRAARFFGLADTPPVSSLVGMRTAGAVARPLQWD